MGTISQQRQGRRDSFSSEDSVETTRGPVTNEILDDNPRASLGHLRSESNASVSTLASFATATEGFGEEDDEDDDHDNFAVQQIQAPEPRSTSPPVTAKRSTFGAVSKNGIPNDRQPTPDHSDRPSSVVRILGGSNGHSRQASNLSLERHESTGTTRNFPLVNRPKTSSRSPSKERAYHNSMLSDSMTLTEDLGTNRLQPSPVSMLANDDQLLVESLVASVGKCVLGLQEAGYSSYEARTWRRRLDAARRVLEGHEGAI